jgi:hypothetical protein
MKPLSDVFSKKSGFDEDMEHTSSSFTAYKLDETVKKAYK